MLHVSLLPGLSFPSASMEQGLTQGRQVSSALASAMVCRVGSTCGRARGHVHGVWQSGLMHVTFQQCLGSDAPMIWVGDTGGVVWLVF